MRKKRDDVTTFLLRDVPNDIWRRARSRAVLEGRSIRDAIIELLDKWAYDGSFIKRATARRPKRSQK
jgi:hypothetical protein